MHSPIFLIGTQRSGTTLLCQMLTAHPDVFIKNELPVRSVFKPGFNREQIEERINYFIEERYGVGVERLLENEKKSIWGLKDPELTNYLGQLEQFLPDAIFIVITRDARAVVNSYIKNKWGLGTNAYTGAHRWLKETKKQLQFVECYPDNTLQIRYEDLVFDQKSVLETVCEFIGIPFSEEMTQFQGKKSFVKESRENRKAFQALDPKMTDKWEKELTGRQINIIENVCQETLKDLCYSGDFKPVSVTKLEIFYYRLHQAVVGELQIQYRWRIGRYKQYIRKLSKNLKGKWARLEGSN